MVYIARGQRGPRIGAGRYVACVVALASLAFVGVVLLSTRSATVLEAKVGNGFGIAQTFSGELSNGEDAYGGNMAEALLGQPLVNSNVRDEALWTPRGYGAGRPQGYGEPYPAWYPGMYPVPPTQEAAALAYAPEFVPYLQYKEYLERVLDAKMYAKRAERDNLASQVYQVASEAALQRQAWLDDYNAENEYRKQDALEDHPAGPVPTWKADGSSALADKLPAEMQASEKKHARATQQQLAQMKIGSGDFSVQDLMAAGDSEAEALGDPSHPDGFWGKWVDGPRPGDDDAVAQRTPLLPAALAARKLHTPAGLAALHSNFYSPNYAQAVATAAAASNPHRHRASLHHKEQYTTTDAEDIGVHHLPSAAQLFHESRKGLRQSLAENPGVDLGSESYAEALMDPSHPSGPWGTWVEPSTSARSVRTQAAAVAKNDLPAFSQKFRMVEDGRAGLAGGRRYSAAAADSDESSEFGRLLDSSTA